ncbi:MAG: trigger factor [Thermonemataceae bacterium]
MEIVLTKKDATNASIKITLNEADYQPKVAEKIKEYSKKAKLKGFRPGKVPTSLIKRMYGKNILVEEVNGLLSTSLNNYLKENDISVVGEPLPAKDEEDQANWDAPSDFIFHFDIGMASSFDYNLDNFEITRHQIQVGDEQLEETLENLRKQHAQPIKPEVSEKGDFIYGALKQVEGEFTVENAAIPTEQLKEAAEAAFVGLKAEDEVTFTMGEAFKDENAPKYILSVYDEEQLKEMQGDFTLTVSEINRQVPAELNQEFYEKIFPGEEITEEEAFKEKVKEVMAENYQTEAENLLNRNVQDKMVEETEIALPEDFLKRWLLTINEGKVTEEQIEKEFSYFEKELRWSLITRKIKEKNEEVGKVETAEVEAKAKMFIIEQFRKYGMMNTEALGDLDGIARNYLMEENGKNFQRLYDQIQGEKITEWIKEQITIVSQEVSLEEFSEIVKAINAKYEDTTEAPVQTEE